MATTVLYFVTGEITNQGSSHLIRLEERSAFSKAKSKH
jgi:hypothetical protein